MLPIPFVCYSPKCSTENPKLGYWVNASVRHPTIENSDEFIIEIECKKCKQSNISWLPIHKVEFFFYSGTYYLSEQRYLDSIVHFNLAWESLIKLGVEVLLGKQVYTKCNKHVYYKKSERIFGGFCSLYLRLCGDETICEGLKKINDKCTSLRNDCIHSGYIPSKEEAENYAKIIYETSVRIFNNIKKAEAADCWNAWLADSKRLRRFAINITFFNYGIFSLHQNNQDSFSGLLDEFKTKMRIIPTNSEFEVNIISSDAIEHYTEEEFKRKYPQEFQEMQNNLQSSKGRTGY